MVGHGKCQIFRNKQICGGILIYLVGEPINVEKKTCISKEDIDQLHEIYIRHLKELFEKYKSIYTNLPDAELEIIWSPFEKWIYQYRGVFKTLLNI